MEKKLALSCPINDLSYGLVSKNILDQLSKKVDISLFPIGPVSGETSPSVIKALNNSLEYSVYSSSLRIFHQFDLSHHIGKGSHIGFPFFELDRFNQREVSHLNRQDLVLVASKWAQRIVSDHVMPWVKTAVVPLGFDPNTFYPAPAKSPNTCVFLNIGKFEKRKGHDILAKAAGIVFEGKDDVQLWMVADNQFLDQSKKNHWVNLYRRELGNKVVFVSRQPNPQAIASVINKSNIGVFPYRAEGWNLPLLECMACGLHVIATNYSAPTEYLTPSNCSLLNPEGMEDADDEIFFRSGTGNWASLEGDFLDQLVVAMETQYQNWRDHGSYMNVKGYNTAKDYTWENTAERILKYV